MSKAENALITSASASKSRRTVILGAGGIAAAGALSAAALALPASAGAQTFNPSPELLEYRRCKAAWNACFGGSYEENEAWEDRVAETSDAVEEAIRPFLELAGTPRSWADVKEIAEVQFTELFEIEDGELHQHSDHDEIDTMLLRAALAMAGNPVEAMPSKPEPDVPAGSVIKLPNRPYAAERSSYWEDYDIVFAGHLITCVPGPERGPKQAAAYFDVPEAVILGWIRTDYIPPAWHPKVYAILEETGQTIAPHILGLAEDALPRFPTAGGANV
jgi:hypothetical protein